MAWKEWQLYDLNNEFTLWQCEMEKVVRYVNLWLIYALLPAVIGNIYWMYKAAVCLGVGRPLCDIRIGRRKRWNPKNAKGCFLCAGAFSLERTVSIHLCTYSQHLLLACPISRASLCRMLVAVIHCITVYKQPPPYIDSNTMLSDIHTVQLQQWTYGIQYMHL